MRFKNQLSLIHPATCFEEISDMAFCWSLLARWRLRSCSCSKYKHIYKTYYHSLLPLNINITCKYVWFEYNNIQNIQKNKNNNSNNPPKTPNLKFKVRV